MQDVFECLLPLKKIKNMGGWRPTKHNYRYGMCLNVFFRQRKIENMGGWRPTRHNYRYGMCLNVFFRQRKIENVGGGMASH